MGEHTLRRHRFDKVAEERYQRAEGLRFWSTWGQQRSCPHNASGGWVTSRWRPRSPWTAS
jgi:hypothetical protein